MSAPGIHPAVQRDLSLQRLRDLTFACAAGAAGLLGVFSIVAATTIPGHTDGGATAAAAGGSNAGFSQSSGDDGTANGGQLQPPAQAPARQPAVVVPHVVSGGSR
ncbi:MAG TPA: hypothetical protein VNF91_02200 [Candidatus Acidoferrum sp.]|nr:hypothetical protein [Candidatus Acidoferrum sp.]